MNWDAQRIRNDADVGFVAVAIILALAVLSSCQRDHVVLRAGSPVVITEARGEVRLSAWDDSCDSLVDLGWVDTRDLIGLTATDYDWAEK